MNSLGILGILEILVPFSVDRGRYLRCKSETREKLAPSHSLIELGTGVLMNLESFSFPFLFVIPLPFLLFIFVIPLPFPYTVLTPEDSGTS